MLGKPIRTIYVPEPVEKVIAPAKPAEPVQGWKLFGYYLVPPASLRLRGPVGWTWRQREETARCLEYPLVDEERSPLKAAEHLQHGRCECGIWLFREDALAEVEKLQGRQLRNDMNAPIRAFVAGWGYVVEHERGWRVQHARLEFLVVSGLVPWGRDQFERRYGVPIREVGEPSSCA